MSDRINDGIRIRVLTLTMLLSSGLAGASTTTDLTELTLEDLLHVRVDVGSRASSRDALQSSVPVTVVTHAELMRSGYRDLASVLQRLLPEFNYPEASLNDLTDHQKPFSLRGMSPDQTLVLVNGKRLHQGAVINVNNSMGRGSTSVDLNVFPLAAIERVELLQDGASAQYGSDAIAGIINIVLRENSDNDLAVSSGITREGDGARQSLGTSFSRHVDNWQGRLSLDVQDRDETNRAGIDDRQYYFTGDTRNDLPHRQTFRYGQADSQDWRINASTLWERDLSWYGFMNMSHRDSEAGAFYRLPLDNRTLRSLYPDGFLPLIATEIDDRFAVVGARSQWLDWQWDASVTAGYNDVAVSVNNSENVSLGNASPNHFDAGSLRTDQSLLNLDVKREWQFGNASHNFAFGLEQLNDRFRIEAGEPDSWRDGGVPVIDGPNAGKATASGAQGFPGFQPANDTDAKRHSYAFYADAEQHWSDSWQSSLALRREHHSDFGNTSDGKLSLRWHFAEDWALRFSAGTGFRAPSLQQNNYYATATTFIVSVPREVGTFPTSHPLAQALGAEALKPERSKHVSLGLNWQWSTAGSTTLDCYQVRVRDRIALSGEITRDVNLFGQEVADLLTAYNVGGARFFMNIIDTQTRGCDLSNAIHWQSEWGDWRTQWQWHWHETELHGQAKAPAILQRAGQVLLDAQEQKRLTDAQPGNNWVADLLWHYGQHSIDLRWIRFGAITTVPYSNHPNEPQTYAADYQWDLDWRWQFTRQWQFALGVHNLLDDYPDKTADVADSPIIGASHSVPYSQQSPSGYDGAFYYLQMSYGF